MCEREREGVLFPSFCRTYTDRNWMRSRAIICLVIGLILMGIGVGVTVS